MSDWRQFPDPESSSNFSENLADGVGQLSGALGPVVSAVDTAVSILDTLSSFLQSDTSPLSPIIEQIIGQVKGLIEDLLETGLYGLFIVPESMDDVEDFAGRWGNFVQKFVESIHDTNDPNRPQVGSNGAMGGLVITMSSEDLVDIWDTLIELSQLFDIDLEVNYPSPINLKARLAGPEGIPIENRFWAWDPDADDAETIRLEWEEPRTQRDTLLGIFNRSKFYIEQSNTIKGKLRLRDEPSSKQTPMERRREEGVDQRQKEPFTIDGEPQYAWEPVDPEDPFVSFSDLADISDNRINFLAGSYAYIIDDIEKGEDNGKYFRVTAVPSDVELEEVDATVEDAQGNMQDETIHVLTLKGVPYRESTASGSVYGMIPDLEPGFDLPSALLQTYRAAYLLRFDTFFQDLNGMPIFGANALENTLPERIYNEVRGSTREYFWEEQIEGLPVPRRTLYYSEPLVGDGDPTSYQEAVDEAGRALTVDPLIIDPFGGVDEYILPRLDLSDQRLMRTAIDRQASDEIFRNTDRLMKSEALYNTFRATYAEVQESINALLAEGVTEDDVVGETDIRRGVATLLHLLSSRDPGTPPNWSSIKFTRDLLPFVDDLAFQLLRTVQSFESLVEDSIAELENTLDGVRTRLQVVTDILDKLDELIAILERFNNFSTPSTISLLTISPETGGTSQFLSQFLEEGQPPGTEDHEYVTGIVLAFGGPTADSVEGFATLIDLIFG